jgi:hypothetical protein
MFRQLMHKQLGHKATYELFLQTDQFDYMFMFILMF